MLSHPNFHRSILQITKITNGLPKKETKVTLFPNLAKKSFALNLVG